MSSAPTTTTAVSEISTDGLIKTYGSRNVVNGVNLRIRAGEILGLLGPNGAGKTTTFYMIVGLVPASAGRVLLDGQDITSLRMHERARRGIGYLPQEASVFRKLTVEENILAIAEAVGIPKQERATRIQKHLEELNLLHVAKQKAFTLSGGERRRLEIARALVTEPKFLLLDEPFAAIDPISVSEIKKIIRHLAESGIGVLITDHNVRDTLDITHRACIINVGEILTQGTRDEILQDELARQIYLGEHFRM